MKNMKFNRCNMSVLLVAFFCFTLPANAQNEVKETLTIPLSDPDKSGFLKVGILRGDIRVTGYTGKQVIVDIVSSNDPDEKEDGSAKKDVNVTAGMKKLSSGGGLQLTGEEEKNTVTIKVGASMRNINLHIKVPRQFSLKLSTVNNGEIVVDNVMGELEISNLNGPIVLNNVSGSAVANTVNGDMKGNFKSINANAPMAFSTLNGNIDFTFPTAAKFDVKLKSDRGDIYSDFDINIEKGKSQVSGTTKEGMYKVAVEDWIKGKINGGGSEIMMKSMSGNIYLRKTK